MSDWIGKLKDVERRGTQPPLWADAYYITGHIPGARPGRGEVLAEMRVTNGSLRDAYTEAMRCGNATLLAAARNLFPLFLRLAEAAKAFEDFCRPRPYSGRSHVVCPQCHGMGDVPGRAHDDPKWLSCMTCKGRGLSREAFPFFAAQVKALAALEAEAGRL